MKRIALLALFFAGVPSALAFSLPSTPTGYVNDFAGVLSATTSSALEKELTAFEASTTNEIAVVIIPSMSGDYVEHYAVKLFEAWQIGKKDKDNGVLLLLSIEERKMRIEVGYGLEGVLPDALAQRILNNEMTPRLKAGDYDGAVTAGVQAIEEATRGEYAPSTPGESSSSVLDQFSIGLFVLFWLFGAAQFAAAVFARSKSWYDGGIVGMIGGCAFGVFVLTTVWGTLASIAVLGLLGALFDFVVSRGYSNAKAAGTKIPWWAGGNVGRGGGGGGGGFGGFGGGSSGGGGASGGW